ncbi:MAG: hypothetical protein LC798_01810 [Chloroflexi bacterium]|nr:hypothetical protein [Chloroflexota bacterium]
MDVIAMQWFGDLDATLQVAVVAGAVAVATALITATSTAVNIWLKSWLDDRAQVKADRALRRGTYRKYADPLTSAAESLFWRLDEIYRSDRGDYLHRGRGLTRYEKHKASSTRYRIAALLGWTVALRKELVLCNAQPDATVGPMRDAIAGVQNSLAEGAHVEASSAQALAAVWGISNMDVDRAGWDINSTVKCVLHERDALAVGELSRDDGDDLLRRIAVDVEKHSGATISPEAIAQHRDEALRAVSTREAWLYRDWQDAIGDWMLVEGDGVRRFDVKGYRTFADAERVRRHDDEEWLVRLGELTDELDVRDDEWADARIAQLRGVYRAVAQLLVGFHEAAPEHSSIDEATLARARELRT